MLGPAIQAALVPVRAVVDGSPVLARRLLAIGADTRGKTARLKELELQALQEQWAKLEEPKRLAAEVAHRKAGRSKRVDAAMSGGVIAVFALIAFGHYLRWVLIALLALWSVAAMAHSPGTARQADEDGQGEEDVADGQDGDVEAEPERLPLAPALLVSTIEHMVATRAQSDGGAGYVLLSEALAVLQRGGWFRGYDTREFGAAVRAAGVPPKKSVAVGSGASRTTSAGWSVAHLQEVLGRAPSLPPQAAVDRTPATAA